MKLVSTCGLPTCTHDRTCRACKNKFMRRWRVTHRLKGEARRRANARAYARVYIRRGKIKRRPCEVDGCGIEPAQMHHDDYSKPLQITFLCARHHRVADALKKERDLIALARSAGA